MKKFAPIAIIALFGAMTFVSCKKDYNCTCTDAQGNKTVAPYGKQKKSDAKKACDAASAVFALAGGSCSL